MLIYAFQKLYTIIIRHVILVWSKNKIQKNLYIGNKQESLLIRIAKIISWSTKMFKNIYIQNILYINHLAIEDG